jgi:hypothetical protein
VTPALLAELERLVRIWTAHGVHTDNPAYGLCAQQLRFVLDQAATQWPVVAGEVMAPFYEADDQAARAES